MYFSMLVLKSILQHVCALEHKQSMQLTYSARFIIVWGDDLLTNMFFIHIEILILTCYDEMWMGKKKGTKYYNNKYIIGNNIRIGEHGASKELVIVIDNE